MNTDVDTLESEVSEQLQELAKSLGNLREQAEAHGSSSKTLSETAAEIGKLISSIASTTEAIQASADAVSKVDTAAVLQELQETRANLETALTTAAQRADSFQERQNANSKEVAASVDTLVRDTRVMKEDLSASVESIQASAQSSAAFTIDKISERSSQLEKQVTDAIDQAQSSLTNAQQQQLAAANASAAKHAEMLKQLAARLSQLEEQSSSQFRRIELAVEKTRERMAEELDTQIGSMKTLVLAFGIISMLGIFATLGLVFFRG